MCFPYYFRCQYHRLLFLHFGLLDLHVLTFWSFGRILSFWLAGLHFLTLWPFGPSFPYIVAFWVFISLHFLSCCSFLGFLVATLWRRVFSSAWTSVETAAIVLPSTSASLLADYSKVSSGSLDISDGTGQPNLPEQKQRCRCELLHLAWLPSTLWRTAVSSSPCVQPSWPGSFSFWFLEPLQEYPLAVAAGADLLPPLLDSQLKIFLQVLDALLPPPGFR